MKFFTVSLPILSLTMLLIVEAHATENKDYFYLQLNGGLVNGLPPKGNISPNKIGLSGLIGVEAGYKLNEYFRMSVSLDHLTNFSWTESTPQDKMGPQQNYKYKAKTWVSMVNIYYDITEIKGFTPYATVGVGISKNQASLIFTESIPLKSIRFYQEGTKSSFAYKFGLGMQYTLNKSINLDLRYQFANLGKIQLNATSNWSELSGDLRAHELLVGIAYKF